MTESTPSEPAGANPSARWFVTAEGDDYEDPTDQDGTLAYTMDVTPAADAALVQCIRDAETLVEVRKVALDLPDVLNEWAMADRYRQIVTLLGGDS